MKTILTLIALLTIGGICNSQSDSLNKYDSNGEKTGKWVVYLDEYLGEVKDSSKAKYVRYDWYKGKFSYFQMGVIGPIMLLRYGLTPRSGQQQWEEMN